MLSVNELTSKQGDLHCLFKGCEERLSGENQSPCLLVSCLLVYCLASWKLAKLKLIMMSNRKICALLLAVLLWIPSGSMLAMSGKVKTGNRSPVLRSSPGRGMAPWPTPLDWGTLLTRYGMNIRWPWATSGMHDSRQANDCQSCAPDPRRWNGLRLRGF